jgi:hypothetical protein
LAAVAAVNAVWTITRDYIDHVSGKSSDKRPQFQAMLAAASRRECAVLQVFTHPGPARIRARSMYTRSQFFRRASLAGRRMTAGC